MILLSKTYFTVRFAFPWVKFLKYFSHVNTVGTINLSSSLVNAHISRQIKSFHLCCSNHAKLFVEVENTHAHLWMEQNSLYSPTICKRIENNIGVNYEESGRLPLIEWNSRSTEEIFVTFRNLSFIIKETTLKFSDPQLLQFFDAFTKECLKFNTSQILTSLQCLSLWPSTDSITDKPFFTIWKSLDKACVQELKKWDTNTALLAADHWYVLNLAKRSEYVHQCLKKICRKLDRLSPQQFVQLMFCVNLCRKLPISASKFEFSYAFENIGEKLTLEELSIVAMGFFKSQTHIKSPHIGRILLTRLESSFKVGDPHVPDSIILASVLKLVRYSVDPTLDKQMYKTLDAIVPYVEKVSILGCLHIALMGTNILLFHEPSTNLVCRRFVSEIGSARLKDIERLAFVLTLFNYDPKTEPCIYNTMISEVRRRINESESKGKVWFEMERHGECLLRFLGFLSLMDIFPLDLIEKAMDPEFLSHVYGKSLEKIGREVLILDVNLEIQCPHFRKGRLEPKMRKLLVKKFRLNIPKAHEVKKITAANRLHFEILETLHSMPGAEETVSTKQILPQFERADIVFCTDQSGVFQQSALPEQDDRVLRCPPECGTWHAVIPGSWNSYMKNLNQPLGHVVCKMKQLETLGFVPTLIPWFEWNGLKTNERQEYLRRKIFCR